MIDYLKKYINDDDLKEIKDEFNNDIINKFEIMEHNVIRVLDYLKEIGVSNFKSLILNRPDICFSDADVLKEKINNIDVGLIVFVMDNDPSNLINFDI